MKILMLAAVLALAGCSSSVEPGLRESYTTKATWKGTRLKVEALPPGETLRSAPGAIIYTFDPAEWNPFLAKTLAEDLKELGSEESDAAVLKIGLVRMKLEEREAGQGSHAECWLRVVGPAGETEYHGVHESHMNHRDSARKAAAEAIKALVEDLELRRGFTVNAK